MLRSSAIASCAALKRALSVSRRPLILARSIVTAPISSRLAILNLCYQTPRILFSPPPPPSSPFGAASARGFATATRDDDSDSNSDADGSDEDIDDELLGLIEAADFSDMDDFAEDDDFVEDEDEDGRGRR